MAQQKGKKKKKKKMWEWGVTVRQDDLLIGFSGQ